MIDTAFLRGTVKRFRSSHQFESAIFWAEKLVAFGKQQLEEADANAKLDLTQVFESDLLVLGELFMLKGEFLRASRILGKYTIPVDSPNKTLIRYHIAKCLFEARQFCEALELLNAIQASWNESVCGAATRKNLKNEFEKLGSPRTASNPRPTRVDSTAKRNTGTGLTGTQKRQSVRSGDSAEMRAACLLLLAKVHLELESRNDACDLLRSALQLDPFCIEAWQILRRGALLSDTESTDLLRAAVRSRTVTADLVKTSINEYSQAQPVSSARELISDLCELHLSASSFACSTRTGTLFESDVSNANKSRKTEEDTTRSFEFESCLSRLVPLRDSVDVQLSVAERALALSNFAEALAVTTRLLDQTDSLHAEALVVHTAALVGLRKANELFRLAHTLMDDADAGTACCNSSGVPLQAVSWYVSAAYYYVVGNREACRKQAGRALQLAPAFVAGWVLVGHTLADDFEYDQAISAYSHANKLCRNSPHTLVCVALAYSRVRNATAAGRFLRAAHQLRTADPYTLNELGVFAYTHQCLPYAVRLFSRAFRILVGWPVNASEAADTSDAEADAEAVRVDFGAVRVALSGEWTSLVNNFGHALRRLGRYDEAIAAHRFALRLNVHHAPTWNALALAQACNGCFDEAAAAVERALRLNGNDVFAYDLFEKLLARLTDASSRAPPPDSSHAASAQSNRYEPVGFDKVSDQTGDDTNRMLADPLDDSMATTTTTRSKADADSGLSIETAFFRKLRERSTSRVDETASSSSVFKVPRAAAWRASVVGVGALPSASGAQALSDTVMSSEVNNSSAANASDFDASASASANQTTTSRDDDGDVVMDDS